MNNNLTMETSESINKQSFDLCVDENSNSPNEDKTKKEPLLNFDRDLINQSLFEMVGTYMFVTLIYLCQGEITKFVFGFWILIVIFGNLSGAHFNPAITLGLYIEQWQFRKGFSKLLFYIIAQFIGALSASYLNQFVMDHSVYVGVPEKRSLLTIIYSEFLFTGLFVFVIQYVSSKHTTPSTIPILNCAMVAAWFFVIVQAGSSLSGAAYNPAVLFILNFIAYTIEDKKALNRVGYMLISEFAGAIVFSLIFVFAFESYVKRKNQKKDS
jgi:glycerol uptake facilitator-like aquaporin